MVPLTWGMGNELIELILSVPITGGCSISMEHLLGLHSCLAFDSFISLLLMLC